jgi:hypothetical protein
MLTAAAYDIHVEQLLERMRRFHAALDSAGIPYRIVGGMAVFIHVSERDPEKARLTADVDAGIARQDVPRIMAAAEKGGFKFRHAVHIDDGVDMLVDANNPRARSSVHFVFVNEKVRQEYVEAVPSSTPARTKEGILIAPVVDLVHMKLTSFRLKDKVHIQDMDSVGLITPEIEATLSPVLAERLAEVRATE